uniref:Uncharacterized protein n=1 Tax=Tetradesmus obliquus TaxID=3088 RepID=A0A383W3Y1_TETOB|eukprot:jgi/Sobl393_1/15637/SZX71873.1
MRMAGARAPAAPGSTEPDAVLHELQLYEDALCASAEAAGILNSLWKKPQQVKLLRRPPAYPCCAKLAPLLLKTTHKAAQITEAVQAMLTCSDQVKAQGIASPAQSFLDGCCAKGTLSTLLQLLLWLQHRAEVLQLPALAVQHNNVTDGSAAAAASSGGGSSSSCSSSSSSNSRSSSISDTSLRYGELWLAVTSALGAVLDCALTLKAADDANGEQEKTLLQLLQLLIQSGLQLHLPEFLGQAVKLLPASGQRLVCRPLSAAVKLMRVIAVLLTSHPFGYSDSASFWPWAEDTVRQLLICGVAAGLLQPPAGGSAAEAAALLRRAASSRSSSNGSSSSSSRNDSSSSSSSAGEAVVALQLQLCDDISKGAESLVALAMRVMLPMRSGVTASGKLCCHFITQPEVTGFVLRLLASRCLLLHKQHVQYQQQQQQQQPQRRRLRLRPRRQLGKCMRGDLLLLPSPQQQLAQLLPGDAFLAADAAMSPAEVQQAIADTTLLLAALDISVTMNSVDNSTTTAAALSVPALQLSMQLLRRAAA